MLNVLLLEDEEYTRRFIKKIVMNSPLVTNVLDTDKGETAIELARKHQPEIAFFDIELSEEESMNGLEVAKAITEVSPNTSLVFITGYSKYAIDSFSVHPYDYILKPVNIEKVLQTIRELGGKYNFYKADIQDVPEDKMLVQNRNQTILISINEIIFIETHKRGVMIHCNRGSYTHHLRLTEIEKLLGESFYRVHKSFIINKDKIVKIGQVGDRSYEIQLEGTDKLALMSRYKYEELKDQLIPS